MKVCKMAVMKSSSFMFDYKRFSPMILILTNAALCSAYEDLAATCCGLWVIWFLKENEPLRFLCEIKSRLRHDLCLNNVTHIHSVRNPWQNSIVLAGLNHQNNESKGQPPGSSSPNLQLMAEAVSAGQIRTSAFLLTGYDFTRGGWDERPLHVPFVLKPQWWGQLGLHRL